MNPNIDRSQRLPVIHYPPHEGLQKTDITMLYYGFSYRISALDLKQPKHMELEQRKLDDIRRLIAYPPAKCEYIGGTVERFDVYDRGNGDVVVMIRVPFMVIE